MKTRKAVSLHALRACATRGPRPGRQAARLTPPLDWIRGHAMRIIGRRGPASAFARRAPPVSRLTEAGLMSARSGRAQHRFPEWLRYLRSQERFRSEGARPRSAGYGDCQRQCRRKTGDSDLRNLLHGHRPFCKRRSVFESRFDCTLTSGLLLGLMPLAPMVFADGSLSE